MFKVHSGSGEPIYQQLMRQIKHAAATGRLTVGAQLPTVRELAQQLLVNPNTVARAYRELERDGVLETAAGRGTFVRPSSRRLLAAERVERLRPFIDQVIAEGRALGLEVPEIRSQVEQALRELDEVAVP